MSSATARGEAAAVRTAAGRRVPVVLPATVAGAWLLALLVEATSGAEALHHDTLVEGKLPVWAALPAFLLAWQLMVAAMMLPSSLPLIRLFAEAARRQPRPGRVLAAFLGGYALVWSAFGALAFVGDVAVHEVVERSPWLVEREWLIAGGVLIVAGAFQFSPMKKRCLAECRHPASFLAARYERGVAGGFRLGLAHGRFCVGCCLGLMLLMFAAGVANLLWMATLTAVMVYEKTARSGARAVAPIGVALLLWAAAVLAHPPWLPPFLSGGSDTHTEQTTEGAGHDHH